MKIALRWLDMVVYVLFLTYAVALGLRGPSWYAGLGLGIVASAPWLIARLQLGASFTVTAQAHRLVTSGLYSKVRHPVYVFGTLAWTGALIVLLGWRALVIGLTVAVIQLFRIRREDRVLADAYGAEYETYRSGTWF